MTNRDRYGKLCYLISDYYEKVDRYIARKFHSDMVDMEIDKIMGAALYARLINVINDDDYDDILECVYGYRKEDRMLLK